MTWPISSKHKSIDHNYRKAEGWNNDYDIPQQRNEYHYILIHIVKCYGDVD